MSKNRFIISDTHFGHANCIEKFKRPDGSPLRDFSSVEEMDETMIERWNAKVKPGDVVYHLGDVVIHKKNLDKVKRLNGSLRLVRGNHDIEDDKRYYEVGFKRILGVSVWTDKFILSHIPLHPDSITNRFRVNVHGHLHANEVMMDNPDYAYTDAPGAPPMKIPDPRYLCVSVEHTNYEPLSFEEVEERIQKRWAETGYVGPRGWGNGSGPN